MILRIGLGLWAAIELAVLAGLTLSADFTKIVLIIAYIFILVGVVLGDYLLTLNRAA